MTLCESDNVDVIVDAATTYMAHRLIEREKALTADYASGGPARMIREKMTAARRGGGFSLPKIPEMSNWREKVFPAFLFFVEFLGSAAFFGLLLVLVMWAYHSAVGK